LWVGMCGRSLSSSGSSISQQRCQRHMQTNLATL
jgi:hypothetical protein